MIETDGRWCEATSSFNQAWKSAGRSVGDGREMAMAYARLAAAPYFDGVTVIGTDLGALGTWVVRTHARTNGVDSRWTIVTDTTGIRSATWTATAFARRPFEASWEGLTALPGAGESYTRLADGLLAAQRGLPTAESARRRRLRPRLSRRRRARPRAQRRCRRRSPPRRRQPGGPPPPPGWRRPLGSRPLRLRATPPRRGSLISAPIGPGSHRRTGNAGPPSRRPPSCSSGVRASRGRFTRSRWIPRAVLDSPRRSGPWRPPKKATSSGGSPRPMPGATPCAKPVRSWRCAPPARVERVFVVRLGGGRGACGYRCVRRGAQRRVASTG